MGAFLLVNINYILSSAYIDVVVHCNVLYVWEFGPLGLYSSPGCQWAPPYTYQMVSEPESLGCRPLYIEQCTWRPLGAGIQVFENQHQQQQLNGRSIKCTGTQ